MFKKIRAWLFEKLVLLIERIAYRKPYFDLEGYMQRWWVFGSRRRDDDSSKDWPICARLHRIIASDRERDLHNHPYRWNISVVLRGGYFEHMPVDPRRPTGRRETKWRGPGSIIFRGRESVHSVQLSVSDDPLVAEEPALTLFIVGPKCQEWGFFTKEGFCPWREYSHYLRTGLILSDSQPPSLEV